MYLLYENFNFYMLMFVMIINEQQTSIIQNDVSVVSTNDNKTSKYITFYIKFNHYNKNAMNAVYLIMIVLYLLSHIDWLLIYITLFLIIIDIYIIYTYIFYEYQHIFEYIYRSNFKITIKNDNFIKLKNLFQNNFIDKWQFNSPLFNMLLNNEQISKVININNDLKSLNQYVKEYTTVNMKINLMIIFEILYLLIIQIIMYIIMNKSFLYHSLLIYIYVILILFYLLLYSLMIKPKICMYFKNDYNTNLLFRNINIFLQSRK